MKAKGKFIVFDNKAVKYQNIIYLERRSSYDDTKIYMEIGSQLETFTVKETVDEIIKCINRSTKRDIRQ